MKIFNQVHYARFVWVGLFAVLLAGTSCKKEDKKNEVNFRNITLKGANEVSPNASTATGTLNATYDKDAKTLRYNISYSGLNPTDAHFHKGAAGVAGPPVIFLMPASGSITSPMVGTTRVLTSQEEADLLSGNWYLNLHSNTYPGGEIRGQLIAN
jgi:hypothetical protein